MALAADLHTALAAAHRARVVDPQAERRMDRAAVHHIPAEARHILTVEHRRGQEAAGHRGPGAELRIPAAKGPHRAQAAARRTARAAGRRRALVVDRGREAELLPAAHRTAPVAARREAALLRAVEGRRASVGGPAAGRHVEAHGQGGRRMPLVPGPHSLQARGRAAEGAGPGMDFGSAVAHRSSHRGAAVPAAALAGEEPAAPLEVGPRTCGPSGTGPSQARAASTRRDAPKVRRRLGRSPA